MNLNFNGKIFTFASVSSLSTKRFKLDLKSTTILSNFLISFVNSV